MNAIILALITYFGWGIGDVFGTIPARTIGPYRTVLGVMIVTLVVFFPFVLYQIPELFRFTPMLAVVTLALNAILIIGNIAIGEALRRTYASLALTIFSSYSALIVLLSVILYKEPLTPNQIISIVIIFIGIFFCTYTPKGKNVITKTHKSGIIWALIGMATIGIYFTAIKPIIAVVGWFWPLYLYLLWIPGVIWLVWKKKELNLPKNWKSAAFPLVASALLLRGGDFFFNSAIDKGLIAVVAPIAGAYPTLSVILAYFVFREVPTRRQITGIVLALTGIVALAWVGSV